MRWFDIPDELLPPVYQKIKDVYAYARTLDTELREFLIFVKRILDNFFVQTCDLKTIEYWEELLDIHLYGDETIEERRNNILLYLNNSKPTTEAYVRQVLDRLFGRENYDLYFDLEHNLPYNLNIEIRDTDIDSINKFMEWFMRMCPAHILYNAQHVETANSEFEIDAAAQSDYSSTAIIYMNGGTETLYRGGLSESVQYIEV
jgi:hypothetical protein